MASNTLSSAASARFDGSSHAISFRTAGMGMGIEKLDAGVVRCVGAARHATLIAQMQQIAAHLALGQLVGRATIVRSKAANPLYVDLLGRGRQTGSRHVRDHSLTQLTHRGHPPFGYPGHLSRRSKTYPRSRHPARRAPTTAKPFSPTSFTLRL